MTGWRYLLDTNIVSDLIRNPTGKIYEHLSVVGPRTACTSIIVACELRFGIERRGSPRLRAALEGMFCRLSVLPFDRDADVQYGRIRAALEGTGRPIGAVDLFIAAHAASLNLILVTHNVKEFGRIDGLKIEDWLA